MMIIDGPSYFFIFSLSSRVEAADDSLQFRKLAHHPRYEIALRKFRGAVSIGNSCFVNSTSKPLLRKPARERANSFDLVAV